MSVTPPSGGFTDQPTLLSLSEVPPGPSVGDMKDYVPPGGNVYVSAVPPIGDMSDMQPPTSCATNGTPAHNGELIPPGPSKSQYPIDPLRH